MGAGGARASLGVNLLRGFASDKAGAQEAAGAQTNRRRAVEIIESESQRP